MKFQNENYDIKKRTYSFSLNVISFLQVLPKTYIYQTVGETTFKECDLNWCKYY